MDELGHKPAGAPPVYAVDGVHLLRTTQQVQYQLSQMADQKASMLLGITFVIFTITVGQVRAGVPQPALLVLGAAAFVSAVLAVTAVLPQVRPPRASEGADNLLFFGAFTRLTQEEYVAHLLATIADPKSVYEAFARDIYQNGRVLAGKKYRLIAYAYRVLLIGLILSFVAFVAPLLLKWLGW